MHQLLPIILFFMFQPTLLLGAPKTLFLVHSYDKKFSWTQEIIDGIESTLDSSGLEFKYHHEYMNAYTENTSSKMSAQSSRILGIIREQKPDMIVTTDDDALEYIGLKISSEKDPKIAKTPVFFNGINSDPKSLTQYKNIDSLKKPGHRITGVFQKSYIQQSFFLLKKMNPDIKTFAVFSDITTTGKALLSYIDKLDKTSLPLKRVGTLESQKFSDWKEYIKKIKSEADVIFVTSANYVVDENQGQVNQSDIFKWIHQQAQIPVVGSWAFQIKHGAFFSATDDGRNQGKLLAEKIISYLRGTKIGDIPINAPQLGVPALNAAAQKHLRFNVPFKQLGLIKKIGLVYKKYEK